jgi:hypothetical protein
MDEEEAHQVMVHEEGPQQTLPPAVVTNDQSSSSSYINEGGIISNRKKWVLLCIATVGITLTVGLGVGLSKEDDSSTVAICHFPADNKSNFNFSTLDVAPNEVSTHLEHGDRMGSCEENCLDICFDKDSALKNATIPVQECVDRCRPEWSSGVAVAVSGSTPEVEIVSCGPSTVVIKGLRASDIVPGFSFINLSDGDQCSACNPLYRMVESVTNNITSGTTILSTTFVSLGDILGMRAVNPVLRDKAVELMAGCPHSRIDMVADDPVYYLNRQLRNPLFPDHCALWRTKDDNDNGRCRYTHCVLGKDAHPDLCFE